MNVAWIFPALKRCGITFYSYDYVKALSDAVSVSIFDTDECLKQAPAIGDTLNRFDCIHIQYETSFFLKKNKHVYQQLCKKIIRPKIVSVHEVYDSFPDVFPKTHIQGSALIKKCKEYLYDLRHPYQTMYTKHLSRHFHADAILVHAQYHKDILQRKGIPSDKIIVIPHAIKSYEIPLTASLPLSGTLHLASSGFITAHYDYSLLFSVLDQLTTPWRFTWIGGIRRDEDQHLLNTLNNEIIQRNWQDRFIISGWVNETSLDSLLSTTDIYLALFSARSSSGSISKAIGARRFIVATSLPLINEINQNSPLMCVVEPDPPSVIKSIETLVSDTRLQKTLLANLDTYSQAHSLPETAKNIAAVYRSMTV